MTEKMIENGITLALRMAEELSISISVAIVDEGGHLLAFRRMDNAILGSIDVAIRKARTSTLFPMSTRDFGAMCEQASLYGMLSTNDGLVGFAGGQPLLAGGGVGVSGGSADQDDSIAAAIAMHINSPSS